MDELIKEMQGKGLITFKLRGKAKPVFDLLNLFATTTEYETDPIRFWICRN